MSDFIQYTQWKQRDESLSRDLEQQRAAAERVAEDAANRPPRSASRRAPETVTPETVAAPHRIHRAAAHQR